MALLSLEEETVRARPHAPFSNSTDGFGWMSIWCDECRHEPGCPLLTLAMTSLTPAAWELRDPGAMNKYTCTEYEASNADEPTLVIDDERS